MKWKIVFILCCSFLLTGCWNYRELNELSIVTGMSIDKDGDDYVVGMLISNAKSTKGDSKEGESQTVVLDGNGKTILDAIKTIGLVSPKELYFRHLLVLVVSEEVAKDGMYQSLDYLFREPQSRKMFDMIIAKNCKAKDTLKIVTSLEAFPSQNISVNISQTSKLQAIIQQTTYNTFLKDLLATGKNPSVNSVLIKGSVSKGEKEDNIKQSEPDTVIEMGTLGIFKKDKLIGWTSKDENRGISILQNKINLMYVAFDYHEHPISVTIPFLSSKSKVTFQKGEPMIEVSIKGTASLSEFDQKENLEDPKVIQDIEKGVKRELQKYIDKALDVTQKKYKSDIFGYGNMIYKNNPTYFKSVKKNWDEEGFPNLKVHTTIHLTLENKGSLIQSIKEAAADE